jgi:hypothetical protein
MAKTCGTDVVEVLRDLLDAAGSESKIDLSDIDGEDTLGGCRVATFEECGVLTNNEGLVLRLADGTEFQLTVVRSS